jgi:hypothetical protein
MPYCTYCSLYLETGDNHSIDSVGSWRCMVHPEDMDEINYLRSSISQNEALIRQLRGQLEDLQVKRDDLAGKLIEAFDKYITTLRSK